MFEPPKSTPWVAGSRGLLSGRPGLGGLVDGFELYWGEPAGAALAASAVVGALDPGDDRGSELVPGVPAACKAW